MPSPSVLRKEAPAVGVSPEVGPCSRVPAPTGERRDFFRPEAVLVGMARSGLVRLGMMVDSAPSGVDWADCLKLQRGIFERPLYLNERTQSNPVLCVGFGLGVQKPVSESQA